MVGGEGCNRYKVGRDRAPLRDSLHLTQNSSVGTSAMTICSNQLLPIAKSIDRNQIFLELLDTAVREKGSLERSRASLWPSGCTKK